MTDETTRARELYAAHVGLDHLWHNRILAGDCDTAPNMQPFRDQAVREALMRPVEEVDE